MLTNMLLYDKKLGSDSLLRGINRVFVTIPYNEYTVKESTGMLLTECKNIEYAIIRSYNVSFGRILSDSNERIQSMHKHCGLKCW